MASGELPTITNKQKALRAVKTDAGYAQMRKDYTRLRDIEQKRLRRAQAAGYNVAAPDVPTLKEIGSDRAALAAEYSRLSKLVESKSSHLPELRNEASKRVATFQELGYSFVTEENELQFGQFMGYMIEKYSQDTPDGKKLLLDSDIIVEGFDYVREHTKSSNHATISRLFNQFLRNEGYM